MELDVVFKALGDPTRRRLLDALADRDGQTLFELMARLLTWQEAAPSRQAVSKHLGLLEEAGLVRVEWQWRSKHHFLQREPLQRLMKVWLGPLSAEPTMESKDEDYRDERVGG